MNEVNESPEWNGDDNMMMMRVIMLVATEIRVELRLRRN